MVSFAYQFRNNVSIITDIKPPITLGNLIEQEVDSNFIYVRTLKLVYGNFVYPSRAKSPSKDTDLVVVHSIISLNFLFAMLACFFIKNGSFQTKPTSRDAYLIIKSRI